MTNSIRILKYIGITLIIMTLFMTYQNYKVVEDLLLERYDGYQETIESSVTSSLNKYQDISMILDNLIDGRLENCTNEMMNRYQTDKDVKNWNLDDIKAKYHNLHIYIIDSDLVMINTTDKEDMGLDFKKFKMLSKLLYDRLEDNVLFINELDISIRSKKVSKYSYMSTPDSKYIFELGIDVEKELSRDLPISSIGIEMVNTISFLEEINIYKVDENINPFRKLNRLKNEKFKFDESLLEFAKQAVVDNAISEYKSYYDTNNGYNIHRFIPLNVYDKNGEYNWWKSYLVEVKYNNKELLSTIAEEKKRTVQMMLLIIIVYGSLMAAIQYLMRKSIEDKKNLEKIIETTNEGFCLLDNEFNIVSVNHSMADITGYNSDELIGVNVANYIPTENLMCLQNYDKHDKAKQLTLEEKILNKNGEEVYVRIQATVLFKDEFEGLFAFVHDITEEKKAETYIKHIAYHDALTNLPNRKYMEMKIEEEYNLSDKDTEFAIMFIDLDDFKLINDNFGHDVGDELLKNVAQRFTGIISSNDMIARIGGDEFILFTSKKDAIDTADRIYDEFKSPFIINGHRINAKLSIGIAYYPEDGLTVEDIIKKADAAMYVSKRNGKNNYIISQDIG